MTTAIVQHTVADYDTWKAAYDQHETARRAHGATSASVHRVAGSDTVDIVVLIEFPDAGSAQAFLSDASLKEAMMNAGVQGPPQISIVEEAEVVEYAGASA